MAQHGMTLRVSSVEMLAMPYGSLLADMLCESVLTWYSTTFLAVQMKVSQSGLCCDKEKLT